MRFQVQHSVLELIQGDIVGQDVDAIVNAANSSLAGGGGVDGAIHRAAGPELLAECRALDGCPTGQARITRGYRLPARHVIHTVGPVWQGGERNEDDLLASCYRASLELARKHSVAAIAFPSISTGRFGFPADRAAAIAVSTAAELSRGDMTGPERIIFCCFSEDAADYHRAAISVIQRARA